MTLGGWLCSDYVTYTHVSPIADYKPHVLSNTKGCWCRPRILFGKIVLHHSMDKREDFEEGHRKPS